MPLVLSHRNPEIVEKMDQPDCNLHKLNNTYAQFKTINALLSGWTGIYKKWIRPIIAAQQGHASLLDIGSGGGDIIGLLSKLSLQDRFDVKFTGIDSDPRATGFAQHNFTGQNINFIAETSSSFVEKQKQFDIVISNHLVHHLSADDFCRVIGEASTLSKRLVIFNDIERSDLGYASFRMIAPLIFRNSFIVEDGLTSIKKSYTRKELRQNLPENWTVRRKFPFRLLAIHKKI